MPDLQTAPAAPAARPRNDLDQLQGTWQSVAGPREARLLVAGSRFAVEFADGELYMGTVFLDARTEPRQMDMRIEEGPDKYKGQLALCIYQLESDVLRWCPTRPGAGYRLTHFPRVDDARYISTVFKHVCSPRPR